jgi:uncharacterized damage-inducible protein DinB
MAGKRKTGGKGSTRGKGRTRGKAGRGGSAKAREGFSRASDRALRAQLAKALDWGDARATFEATVDGIPEALRGTQPGGLPHSAWDLVEHMRLAQADILEFCVSAKYKEKKWPDDYWPPPQAPDAEAWSRSIAAFRRDRTALQRLATNPRIDLLAAIPHGSGQTYLREILLVIDHNAHHLGQLITLRRLLGCWP